MLLICSSRVERSCPTCQRTILGRRSPKTPPTSEPPPSKSTKLPRPLPATSAGSLAGWSQTRSATRCCSSLGGSTTESTASEPPAMASSRSSAPMEASKTTSSGSSPPSAHSEEVGRLSTTGLVSAPETGPSSNGRPVAIRQTRQLSRARPLPQPQVQPPPSARRARRIPQNPQTPCKLKV